MVGGAGAFNKAASMSYADLPTADKERLREAAANHKQCSSMSVKDVMKAGARAFKKIHRQVRYHANNAILLALSDQATTLYPKILTSSSSHLVQCYS